MLIPESKPFQGRVHGTGSYQTWVPTHTLSQWVHYFWQLNVPAGDYWYKSVPDNCVDLIINLNAFDDSILVSPFTTSISYPLTGPANYFGIRFRLLGQHILLSEPINEWSPINHQMPVKDILMQSQLERLEESTSYAEGFESRCLRVTNTLLALGQRPIVDPRVVKFIRYCHQPDTNLSLKQLAPHELAISDRQLRRLSQQYLGVSPKAFCKVLRFQNTLQSSQIAQDCSAWADWYYDQSHFSREFKQLTGVTPSDFTEMSVLYNRTTSK